MRFLALLLPWPSRLPLTARCVAPRAQNPAAAGQGAESRAAGAYDTAAKAGPEALRAFLLQFPKGADLHVHLSGAVYAETFIRDAGEDGLCVDPAALSFAKPPCAGQLIPASATLRQHQRGQSGALRPADRLVFDAQLCAAPGWSGHDQFFATFGHFGGLNGSHAAEWVDEVASRVGGAEPAVSGADGDAVLETCRADCGRNRVERRSGAGEARRLLPSCGRNCSTRDCATKWRPSATTCGRLEIDRKQREHCETAQANAACQVEIRYLYQISRGAPPERVFAQTLLGFETVEASMEANEDSWVGINLVMPEDGYISMRDYTLQMKMIGYLHSVYPRVHITLHAGELAEGLVPPEGLRFHIRQAVELGDAERIGHGVDVMDEDDAQGLLKELARKHVMIEINLSSNEGILGVKGAEHPFPIYFAAKVPVALSTDDEGVSRIDLTHEYVRAALEYNLTYDNLKKLARTGMEHDFLPGASLWAKPDDFEAPVKACQGQTLGGDTPSAACKAFLAASEKATAQWELERRFLAFEKSSEAGSRPASLPGSEDFLNGLHVQEKPPN